MMIFKEKGLASAKPEMMLFFLKKRNNEQKHNCANHGYNEFPEKTGFLDADEAHQPATDKTTDNTDDDVPKEAEAAAAHQVTSQPAGHSAQKQIKNKAPHN